MQFSKQTKIPRYIRNMKNKDSFEADSSILESIDGFTLQYIPEGDNCGLQMDESDIFYPIKHEYKSKPLEEELKKKLKLNFNVLYDDYEYGDET